MPTAATRTLWDAFAAHLKEVDDDTIDLFITLAVKRMSAKAFGSCFEEAAVFLALHMKTLADRAAKGGKGGAIAGPITSVKTGQLSVNYAGVASGTASMTTKSLATTQYGLQFMEIRDGLITTPLVIGEF